MIPSEFNQDVMAQRRNRQLLQLLREELKGPTKDSWLTTAKVGGLFNVFRVFGDSRDAEIERLPRVHTSARAANTAAQAIAAKTGEQVRKS